MRKNQKRAFLIAAPVVGLLAGAAVVVPAMASSTPAPKSSGLLGGTLGGSTSSGLLGGVTGTLGGVTGGASGSGGLLGGVTGTLGGVTGGSSGGLSSRMRWIGGWACGPCLWAPGAIFRCWIVSRVR